MESSQTDYSSMWHILGASVVGTGHRKIGRGCDDAHAYLQLDNGTLLLAVADGAGSAQWSADGARCTVQAALQAARDRLFQQGEPENEEQWHAMLRAILETVRTELERLASGTGGMTDRPFQQPPLPLREYATTLLFTIVTSKWLVAAQIGDGAVVIQRTDGQLETLTWPDHGEYVNETSFVTDVSYLNHLQYTTMSGHGVQGVALFTDGIEVLALDFAGKKAYEPFFTPLFKFAARPESTETELAAFLESERVCKHTDDDKTLVLAVRL